MSTAAISPSTAPATAELHLPLRGDAFLSLLSRSCLAVRAGEVACSACAQACPAHAVAVDGDGPRLVGDCLHCGRCAAACPSGALQADGFLDVMPAPGRGPIEVECAKASARAAPNAVRVPCLGGIAPTLLLQWWLAAGDRPLMLVNRGWCEGCAAGGSAFAAEPVLRQVQEWLQECGVAASRQPGVLDAPTPCSERPAPIPLPPRAGPALSRRGFFRRVTTEVAKPERVASLPDGPRAQVHRSPCVLPARERLLEALQELADRQCVALPAGMLPTVAVNDRCADHGICVRVCPTHALTQVAQGNQTSLRFDAARCVSCMRCEQSCPEQALHLGLDGGSLTPQIVRTSTNQPCVQCGAEFASHQQNTTCPRCRAHVRLARSMFGTGVAEK